MPPGGESGRGGSSESSGPKFSLLTASSLGRLTRGAGETREEGRHGRGPTPHPAPRSPADVLGGRGPTGPTWGSSGLLVAAPSRVPGCPSGERGAPASPPAAASWSAGRGRAPAGRYGAAVPAEGDSSSRPRLPSPGSRPGLPAPTFQLGQHLELGRELAEEIVPGAARRAPWVPHGTRTPAPNLRAAARFPRRRPGAANQRPARPAALSIGQREERAGLRLRAQAGRSEPVPRNRRGHW